MENKIKYILSLPSYNNGSVGETQGLEFLICKLERLIQTSLEAFSVTSSEK